MGGPPLGARLGNSFFDRPVLDVARELIGCTVLHGDTGGIVVEAEAYHETEPAAHSYGGPTPRSKVLFESPGTAYVYFSYGMHTMLNAVVEAEGVGAAVLIRALEPTHGVETMQQRRGRDELNELCSGPGKLAQALGIGLALNETSLIDGAIAIHEPMRQFKGSIASSVRVGITKAADLEWRFMANDSEYVSKPRQVTGR